MKFNKHTTMNYSKLKVKVFFQMIFFILIATVIVQVLYSFLRGRIGEWSVLLLQNIFHLEFGSALLLYQSNIRDNWYLIMFMAIVIFFLIIFHFSLTWFTTYFAQVENGIDALIHGENQPIALPTELISMEQKLKAVKQALEKRELEIQLAQRNKNDLVLYLGHDIKTPLTSIIGYLSLLDEAPDMPMDQKEKYIKITLEKAYHLESLVNEFFEVERYSQQTIPLEKQKIDLSYMLIQMPDEFYPLLSSVGKKIVVDTQGEIITYGDPDKLARAFTNIIKNAIAYSDENSKIEVVIKSSNDVATIEIINAGQTIPPEKQKNIFDRFYRLDHARSTNTGGAGLGLAIANEIIALHQGKISLQSKEGKTVFTIELPIDLQDG